MSKARQQRAATVLLIAESDPSGSGGIQGGLTTLASLGVYGMAVPTALTVRGSGAVQSVAGLPAAITRDAIRQVLDEMAVDAVRIGALHNTATALAVSDALRDYTGPVVVDPMTHRMQRKSFTDPRLRDILLERYISCAQVITPNLKAASALCNFPIYDLEMMISAANALVDMGARCALIKGGGLDGDAVDVMVDQHSIAMLAGVRRVSGRTRGGGGAMSTAVAAALAQGLSPREACIDARQRLDFALQSDHPIGRGTPSLSHHAMRFRAAYSGDQAGAKKQKTKS